MYLIATATCCSTAKKFCDTLHSPAVAPWVNCLNIYLAFQTVCSSLHTAPSAWFQYLRQLSLALLELLPLIMQSQRPAAWTGYLWSQIALMHWKMPTSWCLSANHPVTTFLLWGLRARSQPRNDMETSSFCTVICRNCRHSPAPPPPMLFLKVHHSQVGVNTVLGTAFANSSVSTRESVGLQKSRF